MRGEKDMIAKVTALSVREAILLYSSPYSTRTINCYLNGLEARQSN